MSHTSSPLRPNLCPKTVVATLAMALAALSAQTAHATTPAPVSASAVSSSSDADAKRYIRSYHTEDACHAGGREGVRKKTWTSYQCTKSAGDFGPWDLWAS